MEQQRFEAFRSERMAKSAEQMLALNPFGYMTAAMMATSPWRRIWAAQEQILNEVENYTHAWIERRHEATRKAMDALNAMSQDGNPDAMQATSAISDWFAGSIARMSDDVRDAYDFSARCLKHASAGEVEAGERMLRAAEDEADEEPIEEVVAPTRRSRRPS